MHRVLVVDDDPDIRALLGFALQDDGYAVRSVENGRAALELLLTSDWLPDLILLDLMMPVMDGWTFRAIQRAHDSLPPIPVIVVSAAVAAEQHTEVLDPSAVIAKPFDLEDVQATVRAVLERSTT
jgi:DNA-binding response OmpR family regulator